jgi:RHH-type proline utilization regulon transcriptional repressor/proline dehydrogenase/delta 1-pyrroline-5-carboxylate dehydrogenase
VLAVAPGAVAALSPLAGKGLPLAAIDGTVAAKDLADLHVDVVALSGGGEGQRAVRMALAKRQGPIVPLVTEAIYPAAYAHERAVCVDTTAAGGNASLLATA